MPGGSHDTVYPGTVFVVLYSSLYVVSQVILLL